MFRYGNAETVTKYWTCLICHKELKCQKGIIIQHLLNVHAMELIDYERQYMDPRDQVIFHISSMLQYTIAALCVIDKNFPSFLLGGRCHNFYRYRYRTSDFEVIPR